MYTHVPAHAPHFSLQLTSSISFDSILMSSYSMHVSMTFCSNKITFYALHFVAVSHRQPLQVSIQIAIKKTSKNFIASSIYDAILTNFKEFRFVSQLNFREYHL